MRAPASLCFAALTLLPLAAHATTIDDFTYTDGTQTIQYSLPATSIFPEIGNTPNFVETATATIGVPGYSVKGRTTSGLGSVSPL